MIKKGIVLSTDKITAAPRSNKEDVSPELSKPADMELSVNDEIIYAVFGDGTGYVIAKIGG